MFMSFPLNMFPCSQNKCFKIFDFLRITSLQSWIYVPFVSQMCLESRRVLGDIASSLDVSGKFLDSDVHRALAFQVLDLPGELTQSASATVGGTQTVVAHCALNLLMNSHLGPQNVEPIRHTAGNTRVLTHVASNLATQTQGAESSA